MKTKEELKKEIEAMANTFKFVILTDSQIDSMLDSFSTLVQLYQTLVRRELKPSSATNYPENYKLSSRENDLLKKVTQ